jgi:ADP-dependent NAD(P)H-hydrate dehydratase / NAD(P)H-hydrate epimerase
MTQAHAAHAYSIRAHTVDDVRRAEATARAGLPDDVLMHRAAAGLATSCARLLRRRDGEVRGGQVRGGQVCGAGVYGAGVYGARVVLLVGPGDNGGDALLAGARLRRRGVAVTAVLVSDRWHEAGLAALRDVGGEVVSATARAPLAGTRLARERLAQADLVVDAVVGIGGRPGLDRSVVELLAAISPGTPVLAVDLPSGIDVATGQTPGPHVRADLTVTFGTLKPGLLLPPATWAAGRVEVVDLGLGPHLPADPVVVRLTSAGAAAAWPTPRPADHKYSRGVLGVVAGSERYPGAAVLACDGAVRAGAGLVRYLGPALATAQVLAARPEVVAGRVPAGRVHAWLVGPGAVDDPDQAAAVEHVLDSGLPHVVDAGSLAACVRARAAGRRAATADQVLLTPHAGELARLLGLVGHPTSREQVEAAPWRSAHLLAERVEATVLLKGAVTLVVPPRGPTYSQADGTPWLASAGTGDVLSGVAGALLAAGVPAPLAGALAALVHGRAGRAAAAGEHGQAGGPVTASDVAHAVPAVVAKLRFAPLAEPGLDAARRDRVRPKVRRVGTLGA